MHSYIQALVGGMTFNLHLKDSTLGVLIVVLGSVFHSWMNEVMKAILGQL